MLMEKLCNIRVSRLNLGLDVNLNLRNVLTSESPSTKILKNKMCAQSKGLLRFTRNDELPFRFRVIARNVSDEAILKN
jgi:hypothetical protein